MTAAHAAGNVAQYCTAIAGGIVSCKIGDLPKIVF